MNFTSRTYRVAIRRSKRAERELMHHIMQTRSRQVRTHYWWQLDQQHQTTYKLQARKRRERK